MSLVCTNEAFTMADGSLIEFYAVERHFTLLKEGPVDLFFDRN